MFFEDFKVGKKLVTRSRVITPTDVDLFAGLTGAVNPLFLSDEAAKKRGFEGRIAPGLLVLSTAVGLMYQLGIFDNIIALTSVDGVRFRSPVRPGDEIAVECEVVEKKESRAGDRGLVRFRFVCRNLSRGSDSVEGYILLLYPKRGAGV